MIEPDWFPAEWTPEQRQYFLDMRERENQERMAKAVEIVSGRDALRKKGFWAQTWARLGYGWANPQPVGEEENETKEFHYWGTTIVTRWDWWERILILFSGTTITRSAFRADAEVTGIVSNSASAVLPPNFKET